VFRLRKSRLLLISLFALFLFLTSVNLLSLHAAQVSKEEVLTKYKETTALAEELNVYGLDILPILPKIRAASEALLKNNFDEASQMLDEAGAELKVLELERAKQLRKEFKLDWLEILIDVVQKFLLFALLAFVFVRIPFFQRMLKAGRFSFSGKAALLILSSGLSVLFSWYDLSRYGESAWSFFDPQLVLMTAGGLFGGFWVALLSGIFAALFRWLVEPKFLIYSFIAIAAGISAGFFSTRIRSFQNSKKISFFAGALAGTIQGLVIYLPAFQWTPWFYILLSVALLALLEGSGVFLIFWVVSAVLREESRREIAEELLKTKLLFLQAQINPHFLFNALNTISAVCGEQNTARAQRLILRLSDFLARTLKRGDEKVTLREEMDYIDSYLEIEQARFGDRLKVEKHFDLQEKSWETKIPLLILQPLVENAIKHGIGKKESGGTLRIQANDQEGVLTIEVADDGVGADLAIIQSRLAGSAKATEGLGIGIRNIHERLARHYGSGYGLKFESPAGGGLKAIVRIPLGEERGKV
jgi:LytS/YehU family sensor histidine kinase